MTVLKLTVQAVLVAVAGAQPDRRASPGVEYDVTVDGSVCVESTVIDVGSEKDVRREEPKRVATGPVVHVVGDAHPQVAR